MYHRDMKKKLLIIIVVILLLIIWFIWSTANKKEVPTPIETPPVTITPIPTIESNLLSIDWFINDLDLPKQVAVIKKESGQINDELVEKVAKYFGFEDQPALKELNLTMYKTADLKSSMDVNKDTNIIKYNKNLLLFPIEKTGSVMSNEEMKDKLNDLIKSVFELNQVDLRFDEINYQEIYGPRYILSNKEEATIVEIKAVYLINNYPIFSQNGYPVIVKFTRDGVLVNLAINWPGKLYSTETFKKIKSFDKIKNTKGSEFKIISVDGDKYFDMSQEDEVVKKTEITEGYFGFLNSPQKLELEPSVFLEGKSNLDTGPVSVMLTLLVSE